MTTTKVIERTEGRYESHEEYQGVAYVWRPRRVVVECECGERVALNATTESTCWCCGENHADLIEEEEPTSRRPSERIYRRLDPLDRECREWREKQEEYLRSEEYYRLELSAID